MADYLSLADAAKKLGIPTDRLVELRSQGQVRGFRDGASWKFPQAEIDRLADELPDLMSSGSGILVDESGLGSAIGTGSGSVIGGDTPAPESADGSGSDIGVGVEPEQSGSGSDVNLVAADSDASDVAIVTNESDLLLESNASDLVELDSAELKIEEPAVTGDSDAALKTNNTNDSLLDSELNLVDSTPDAAGVSDASDADAMGSDIELQAKEDSQLSGDILSSGGVSSLELMSDLDVASEPVDVASMGSRGADVLSELDLLSAENKDSGLITGDSADVLSSSGLGSSMHGDAIQDSQLSSIDDALDGDDDLIIADDDEDLTLESSGSNLGASLGSDLSVAGDSGINLMSPSDSGLSLEAEPGDLGGSSISALDLGAELAADGSGIGSGSGGGGGSGVDFQADEEFQLSPSGIGLEADIESGSQVIEIEDSGAVGDAVELSEDAFADAEPAADGEVFDAQAVDDGGGFSDGFGDDGDAMEPGKAVEPGRAGVAAAYEVPFSLYQCIGLMMILLVMGLSGMLMTDLVRNMWAYSEVSAPVSSLTDSLISVMGWNP